MTFSTYHLQIKAKTWGRDSFGLFDYETNKFTNQSLSLSSGGKLSRDNDQLAFRNLSTRLNESRIKEETQEKVEEPLISISDTPHGIRISSESQELEDPHQFWIVIEQEKNQDGYPLKVNDVIRFGRVVFRVKQLKIVNKGEPNKKSIVESLRSQMNMLQAPFMISSVNEQSIKGSTLGERACKICLSEKSDEQDDPLISPCKCIGSVKYVHLKCMQHWVMSKLSTQENKNILTIFWKNLDCELCKERLPLNLVHHGKEFSLIPFDSKMSGSYIMMESFSKEKNSTGIHLIDLSSNEQFKIGRGHDCDLKIIDISVSRTHALLIVKKGKIYLKDSQSKFGTLILRKEPIILNSRVTKSPWVQWGRTFMRFTLKKQWLAYLSCVRLAVQTNEIENTGPQIEIKQSKKKGKGPEEDESLIRLDDE